MVCPKITFATLTTILPLLATSITAAPQGPSELSSHGLPGAFYLCTSPNWTGSCAWNRPGSGCRIAGTGSQPPQSIDPDEGGYCILYKDVKCKQQVEKLTYPGKLDGLPEFTAVKCFADGTGPIIDGQTQNLD